MVVQTRNEDISDELADQLVRVADLFNRGYRCRFDTQVTLINPIKENEQEVQIEHCKNCEYSKRGTDQYCLEMIKVWNILCKLPKEFKKEYSCACPNECEAGL